MPVYSYSFKDAVGQINQGTTEAESEEGLRARFTEQGLEVVEVTLLKKKGKAGARNYGKVKLANLSIFCRQFSTMVDAGVSLVRCLDVLSRQTDDPKLKKILLDVGERVEGGESLSRSMQRHPDLLASLNLTLRFAAKSKPH
jgi:type IV pilus assembly protein PilC